ncbi:hypothetical protein [Nocardioides sp. T2.26MG-1]|uniref:hypothetical protein n=1 Tax=Nocardioides sp. T2.26MG-1 TaxID=3041166 RepID=UPI002477A3EA|nr:hypothetical protein [Nocardioides sp. T2.26MG-1]CAI9416857.1 hypothetical protein HIDPHFAB_02878 [Nocardioides sp. T2.26MG-1]
MTDLRERMEHLVDEVPAYVVPDARRAWAAGARRRLARRIGAGVAVVVLVALTAGLVGVLPRSSDVPPADGERGSGVDGYPSRIEKPWILRDLPDRPGPLAATVELETDHFIAVSPSGDVWRIVQEQRAGDFFPSLSADGRMIGYLADHGAYVLRDLVTGAETRFEEIGDNANDPSRPEVWWTQAQVPGYWSPDGSTHLVQAWRWDADRSNLVLLLGTDGSLRQVERPGSEAYPVGWLDDGLLGWLTVAGKGRRATAGLAVTDETGAVLRRAPLDLPARLLPALNQWSGSLSPDGARLGVAVPDEQSWVVSTFATSDGARTAQVQTAMDVWEPCSMSWRGRDLVLPVLGDGPPELVTRSGERVMAADPALNAYCVMTAGDALGGDRHRAVGDLFGTTWLSWHWRQVLLDFCGALALAATFTWFLRRRGRHLRRA